MSIGHPQWPLLVGQGGGVVEGHNSETLDLGEQELAEVDGKDVWRWGVGGTNSVGDPWSFTLAEPKVPVGRGKAVWHWSQVGPEYLWAGAPRAPRWVRIRFHASSDRPF